jgi:hypothetical protein
MLNTSLPQNNGKEPQNQTRSEFEGRLFQRVRQDKRGIPSARTASPQASRIRDTWRARPLDTNSDRVQKSTSTGPAVQACGWVKQPISDEINRIAQHYGQTRSGTIATLLEEAVHQRLHIQHAVMLSPLVRKSVIKAIQGLLPLLISIAYDSHQTRHLTGNVLAKTVSEDDLDRIREKTEELARKSILYQRTQIEDLVDVAKQWFVNLEREEETGPT